jgi:DNA-directed RNA polymerase subunit alpha
MFLDDTTCAFYTSIRTALLRGSYQNCRGGEIVSVLDVNLSGITRISVEGNSACYKIQPVFAGFSIALASALRRVLLSSLPGAAITSLSIKSVLHEFQDIPNVKEDVTDIVQNLKKVRLRSYVDQPVTVYLEAQGEGVVTAGDIRTTSTIEIVNPDHPIATLDNEHADLHMQLIVETGRGFIEASEQAAQRSEDLPIGVILLDAIYSPVTHVNFTLDHNENTDLDTIVLSITTDGAISPDEALRQSAAILSQQFKAVRDYLFPAEVGTSRRALSNVPIPPWVYEMPVEDLALSHRAHNILKRNGLTKVGQVLEMDGEDIAALRNVGEKTMHDLYACLKKSGALPDGVPL